MSKILVRYRESNGGLYLQKRKLNIFTIMPYLLHKLLIGGVNIFSRNPTPSIPDWAWSDWSNMNNPKALNNQELNWHTGEIKRLLSERKQHEEFIKVELKSIKDDSAATRGHSNPFYVQKGKLGPIGLNFSDPGEEWKGTLNSKMLGTGKKTASGKGFGNGPDLGHKTTYVPEDFNHVKFAIDEVAKDRGSDGLVMYKHQDQKRSKGGGSGGFNPKNRKKQSGESPEGHQARLQAINSGDNTSDWQPW